MTEPALTTPIRTPEDADAALRPKTLGEFVGQAFEMGQAFSRKD